MMVRRKQCRRRGTISTLAAISLVPLLMITALVVDGGVLMSRQRQTQAVADAAAHAAACSLSKNYSANSGLDPSGTAAATAIAIATSNGYPNDHLTSEVTVRIPPLSGSFTGKNGNAEVVVTYYQPRFFSGALGTGTIPVTARSVGRVISNPAPSIILTDTSSAGAFTLTGGARVTATGTIQVNSSNAGAVNASNGAYLTDSGGMNIVGGYSIPNWATWSTFFSKVPLTGQPASVDPYSSITPPSTSGLTARSAPNPPYGSATILPGVYNGGLTLGGGMTITMSPGIYYMKGGNFTVANGVNLSGSGVMIYMDTGAISLQGGTIVNLSAPTSGTYKNIVYYQDRNNTSSLNNIANGATVAMSGALYAPNASLAIAGGAYGSTYGSQFIVKSLNVSNGVNITITTPSTISTISAPFVAE